MAKEIKNQVEFNTYTEIEEKIRDVKEWLEFYVDVKGAEKTAKKLQKIEDRIYKKRSSYQKKQLKELIKA
jgi:hypothetical protein